LVYNIKIHNINKNEENYKYNINIDIAKYINKIMVAHINIDFPFNEIKQNNVQNKNNIQNKNKFTYKSCMKNCCIKIVLILIVIVLLYFGYLYDYYTNKSNLKKSNEKICSFGEHDLKKIKTIDDYSTKEKINNINNSIKTKEEIGEELYEKCFLMEIKYENIMYDYFAQRLLHDNLKYIINEKQLKVKEYKRPNMHNGFPGNLLKEKNNKCKFIDENCKGLPLKNISYFYDDSIARCSRKINQENIYGMCKNKYKDKKMYQSSELYIFYGLKETYLRTPKHEYTCLYLKYQYDFFGINYFEKYTNKMKKVFNGNFEQLKSEYKKL